MSNLIDYTFDSTDLANPDGSFPVSIPGASVTAGPGDTALGHFDTALQLGAGSGASVDVSALTVDPARFTAQVVFSVDAVPTAPQTLLACTAVPFSLTVERGTGTADASVVARVTPRGGARAGASTAYARSLTPGHWYTATLVYDTDTVAVYVDGALAAVHAFPDGTVVPAAGGRLHLGQDAAGGAPFQGRIAALQWQNDIPAPLETALDAARSNAQWFVSYKYEALPAGLAMGEPRSDLTFVAGTGAYVQHYEHGLLMYADGAGVAFEMHGDIYGLYTALADPSPLGFLVSDEMDSRRAGGRKSLFSEGGIYWSPATGAVPVVGHLYLDYERMGESSAIGFPVATADPVPGGLEQVFQGARMYLKDGASVAHEVHGDILGHYLALGGPARWGFPLTDESDVRNGSTVIGRFNEFEACTIFWSASTGAFEVHGDIRERYRDLGGPAGALGFPTSDEGDIPGAAAPARFNTFQNGSLLWFGSAASMITALPFHVYLGRIETVESEGFLMGQNDLYFRVTLTDGAATLFSQRYPSSGDYGNNNSRDADLTLPVSITPNRADMEIVLTVDVWDSDDGAPFGGGDDHLGTWVKTLNMANGWGLAENGGILQSGHFANINNISAAVQPEVDAATLSDGQKWWGVTNQGTPQIGYQEYADAFSDVEDDPKWWSISDDLERAFYSLVVEGLAANGNCFGMSLEGINSRKGVSLYSAPLDRFTNWGTVSDEFNIKHCYQVGSSAVWWFVGEFLSGRTHDPVAVFNATEECFARGDSPVLCLSQNADFSGAPHCLMPIGWDRSSTPWRLTLCDPNFPATTRVLTVDPDTNSFTYVGRSTYSGTSSSGGRMHYMPYRLLSSPPRTPIWDAIALILAGTVVILGSDARTESITDHQGTDLDAFGERARQVAASGRGSIDDCFFSLKGVAAGDTNVLNGLTALGKADFQKAEIPTGDIEKVGPVVAGLPGRLRTIPPKPDSPIVGEVLMRRDRSIQDVVLERRPRTPITVHVPVGTVVKEMRGLAPVAADLVTDPALKSQVAPMTVHQVAAHSELMGSLSEAAQQAINGAVAAALVPDLFSHTVRGADNGVFDYTIKRGLTEIRVTSPIGAAEQMSVTASGLATSKSVVVVSAETAKTVDLHLRHKLGVGPDHLAITVHGVPVAAGAPIQLNAKPGLGGVEIVAGNAQVDLAVSVEAVVGGRQVANAYTVPLQGGARINPAPMLNTGTLQVSRIDTVFGPALSKALLTAH